jgi:quinol monooxygenase YgiN
MSNAPEARDDRTPALVIAGAVRIDPANVEAASAAAVEMMRETRKEPGCISYAFTTDLEEPGTFRIFEEWVSQEALDAHFATPHMAAFQGRVGGLGVREMTVQKYQIESVGPLG